jgi:hypothetical protein
MRSLKLHQGQGAQASRWLPASSPRYQRQCQHDGLEGSCATSVSSQLPFATQYHALKSQHSATSQSHAHGHVRVTNSRSMSHSCVYGKGHQKVDAVRFRVPLPAGADPMAVIAVRVTLSRHPEVLLRW